MGVRLFHEDRQTNGWADGRYEANRRFRNIVNAPKNGLAENVCIQWAGRPASWNWIAEYLINCSFEAKVQKTAHLEFISSQQWIYFCNVQWLIAHAYDILCTFLAKNRRNSLLLQCGALTCVRRSLRGHFGRHIHISFYGSSLQMASIYKQVSFRIVYTCSKSLHVIWGSPNVRLLHESLLHLNKNAVIFTVVYQY